LVPYQDRKFVGVSAALELWSDRSWVHNVGIRYISQFFTTELGASGSCFHGFDRYRAAIGVRPHTRTETAYLLTAESDRITGKLEFVGLAVEVEFREPLAALLLMEE
jgi:hypothetical protein